MSLASEFREFAVKGNVMDLAVGVIIGAAFGKIVESLVGDIIMPIVASVFGNLDFSSILITLKPVPATVAHTYVELKKAGIPFIAVGNFLSIVLNFIILAFVVFLLVKAVNKMRRKEEAAPAAPKEEIVLLTQIRDSLRAGGR